MKIIPPSDVCHSYAIDDVASDGEDYIHDCELGRECDERLLLFPFSPCAAASERKVSECGHQHDGGVGHDRLEDVLVPARDDAKDEAR